jgi:hypothetical protein
MNDQATYTISADNWNPKGIEHWTEEDIRATAEAFGLSRDSVTIDLAGRVFAGGVKIGIAE